MDLNTWKQAARDRLVAIRDAFRGRAPGTLYGALSAAAILPVVAAVNQGDFAALVALTGVVGGVGGNLIANQIQAWKDKSEAEIAANLTEKAQADDQWREALDTLIEKLDVVAAVEVGLSQADQQWFQETLQAEVERLGSRVTVNVKGNRNVAPAGDIRESTIFTGDNATYIERLDIRSAVFHTPPQPGHVDPKELLWTYLNQVISDTGALDLSGVDKRTASDPEAARLELAAVYTALDTLRLEERRRTLSSQTVEQMELPFLSERQSVLAFVNDAKYAALLGDPGSGKTTFANFLALCLAGEILGEDRANLARLGDAWKQDALLPVRVVLRQFAAHLPAPPDASASLLWDYIIRRLGPGLDGFAPLLRKHLVQHGGLLILDGLDEVPEAHHRREIVKGAVLDFKRQFPKVRILLTSRTYAYQNRLWRLPGFDEAVLAPFTPEQVDLFVNNWYAHMAQVRPNLSSDEAQGRAERLKETIHRESHLAELAERPLLLTLMASLHAWRGGALPEDREQLYDESVELLLDVWERPKEVVDSEGSTILQTESLAEWLRAPQADVRQALEALAFRAHRDQPQRTGAADIGEDALAGALLKVAKGRDLTLDRIIDYILDRTGLLVNLGEGIYSFPHRTFQEYLAARHLSETDFPGRLVELVRADPERWREVMLLAGAKVKRGTPFAAWALVDALCFGECGDGAGDADWYAALLAGQLLVETGMHKAAGTPATAAKVARVRGWLTRLVREGHLPPVDRAAAGRALGWLGDERPGVSIIVRNGAQIPDIDWIAIEPGPFIMGNDHPLADWAKHMETPQFTCQLITRPYRISRYPVTVMQYQAFVDADGYQNAQYWSLAEAAGVWRDKHTLRRVPYLVEDRIEWKEEWADQPLSYGVLYSAPNQPRVGVTWYEAAAFCAWLSEVLGKQVRLPTEAEWERAARHTDGRAYPWGNDFNPQRCNMGDTGIGAPSTVGIFPNGASACGVHDMAGNVWEWCSTKWLDSYDSYETRVDDSMTGSEDRVVRGSAFDLRGEFVECAFRLGISSVGRSSNQGFRVVSPASDSLASESSDL
ncbi:MAG: SUMF1/EgtB/PvdO family nonheme iron enzyme [Anaerolineae bacterium]